MVPTLEDDDLDAIDDAFDELELTAEHLDAVDACTPLFGTVKQKLQTQGKLDDETREAFIDRIIDLYVKARSARERIEEDLPNMSDEGEREAAEEESDEYHRDAAALLNAVSMLGFIDSDMDRNALLERIEEAYVEHQ